MIKCPMSGCGGIENGDPLNRKYHRLLGCPLADAEISIWLCLLPIKVNNCLTPNCSGIGNNDPRYRTHRSVGGCPLIGTRYTQPWIAQASVIKCPMSGCGGIENGNPMNRKYHSLLGCPLADAEVSIWLCSLPIKVNNCPRLNCSGIGNNDPQYKTHRSISGCPLTNTSYTQLGITQTAGAYTTPVQCSLPEEQLFGMPSHTPPYMFNPSYATKLSFGMSTDKHQLYTAWDNSSSRWPYNPYAVPVVQYTHDPENSYSACSVTLHRTFSIYLCY